MLLCRAGCATAYLVIIADVLVGAAPEFGGVLPTLLNRHDGVWFLSRAFVVGAVCRGAGLVTVLGREPSSQRPLSFYSLLQVAAVMLAVILPMLLPRTLVGVSRFSRLGITAVTFVGLMIVALSGVAIAEVGVRQRHRAAPAAPVGPWMATLLGCTLTARLLHACRERPRIWTSCPPSCLKAPPSLAPSPAF